MADYGLAAQVGAGGGQNAFNPMQSMAQFQTMSNAMLQGQQLQQQMQQQNALRGILSQSGGKVTPEIIQGLVASGNYEPALALQRHQASISSIGVQTQAAQTALEEARLKLNETKRTIAASNAVTDYLAKTPDYANPDNLDVLRKTKPDAWRMVIKHIDEVNAVNAQARKEGTNATEAQVKLAQTSANFVLGLLPGVKDQASYNGVYNYIVSKDPKLASIVGPEFNADNLSKLQALATQINDLKTETKDGVTTIVTPRLNMENLVGGVPTAAPTVAAPFAQTAQPVMPLPNAAPGVAASMNATNAMGPAGVPAANAMVAQPSNPAAEARAAAAERKRAQDMATFRQQEEIKSELNPKGQLTEEQTLKLQKDVGNELADTRNTLAALDDTLKAAKALKALPAGAKESITGPVNARFPSTTEAALNAETKLENLKGVVTRLGKEAASAGGAIGNMAVQEWKIVQNMIASLDTTKMNGKILDQQLDAIMTKAEAAAKRTREAYNTTYKHVFEKFPGRFDLEGGQVSPGTNADIDALLKKYEK